MTQALNSKPFGATTIVGGAISGAGLSSAINGVEVAAGGRAINIGAGSFIAAGAIALSPDGRTLVCADKNRTLQVWQR